LQQGVETRMESLLRDLRYALRSLTKDRRFVVMAVFALALGIGASTVVFGVFYSLLLAPFSAKEASRLAVPSIEKSGQELFPLTHSMAVYDEMRRQSEAFEDLVAYTHRFIHVTDGHAMRQIFAGYVTDNAFDFYGVPALRGRGLAPGDGQAGTAPVFVIGYQTWRTEFNEDSTILGKSFFVDGRARTLIGIMPPRFQAYGRMVGAWIPIGQHDAAFAASRPDLFLIGRLKPGVSTDAAAKDLEIVLGRLSKVQPAEFPDKFTVKVQSATDYFLGPWGIGSAGGSEFGLKQLLYNLLAAVLTLLLIACSNVANLLLARATTREKEIAVRAALGATRGQLVRQLLVESGVLAFAACAAGCLLAVFGARAAAAIVPEKGIGIGGETEIRLNVFVLLFAVAISVMTALISGLAPALHAVRTDLQPRLTSSKLNAGPSGRLGKLRSGLVVAEVALSIVLLVGAGLLLRSFLVVTRVELGFDARDLLFFAIDAPAGRYETPELNKVFLEKIMLRLKAAPGIKDAAVNNSLPGYNGGFESEVAISSQDRGRVKINGCSESLLRTMQLRLIRGSWLSASEVDSAQRVAVVNETLARQFFGSDNPVGKQMRLKAFEENARSPGDAYFRVVGVVGDVKNNGGPEQSAMAGAFIPYTIQGGTILLVRTAGAPASMKQAVQEAVWSVDRDVMFVDFEPVEETLQRLTYSAPEFGLKTLGSLAGLALLLVVIGVFSVMAYTVSLQTQEIGVRMALGAQQRDVLGMVLKKGFVLLAAGICIGVLVSFGLTRFLASQIWGVSPKDPWTFGAVVALVVISGLAACLWPVRRAASVDPMVALRYE
jgi:putative ABC transport system permease protein